jgi:glycerol-3-phosphate dehydrogenase
MPANQQKKSPPTPTRSPDTPFDVLVIGAGVVGCALARRFALQGAKVAIAEKASDILDGASKANSAILHTGFDAPPGSLELACIRDGYDEYIKIHRDMGLPLENDGAHVIAWTDEEAARLEGILDQAHTNGVTDVRRISAYELARREPNLARTAKAAIFIPGESIIDPWSAPYAYLHQALMNGAQVFLSCNITGGKFDGDHWSLQTTQGPLKSKYVINCAGLYGDRVDKALLGHSGFHITPRKGQFVVFDKAASKLITSVILPVPTARTKGVVLFKTIFGNLAVGPTAEDQQSRTDSSTDETALRGLIAAGVEKLPALETMPVTAVYAGLRPASEFKDYQIAAHPERNWISVGAIRSTGLSGALGIARHVYRLYGNMGPAHDPVADPKIPQATILAQKGERDWRAANHGEIVCHCELVTSREIKAALSGPLAARSLAGLKRQTRATMGRCQGFFCTSHLAELTGGHFEIPLAGETGDE